MGEIFTSFFAYLIKWVVYGLEYMAGIVAGCFDAAVYYVFLIISKVTNPLFDLVVSLLDGSGIGAAITTINGAFTGALGYFAGYLLIPQSAAAIVTAYLLRFTIRRIPFIG